MPDFRAIRVIGAGRAGCAIAAALATAGWRVTLVCREAGRRAELTRWAESAGLQWRLVGQVGAQLEEGAVLFATADRDLAEAARQAGAAGLGRYGPWLHLSGVAPASVLQVEGGAGSIGSVHPLAAILDPFAVGGDLQALTWPLRGAFFALAGDEQAVQLGGEIARACGGEPAALPEHGRSAYHAAASVVANDLVSLVYIGEQLATGAGMTPMAARKALLHLAATSLRAMQRASTAPGASLADGLTGAVGRGDATTLAAHMQALADDPTGRDVHAALSGVLLELVGERLTPEQRAAVAAALAAPPPKG